MITIARPTPVSNDQNHHTPDRRTSGMNKGVKATRAHPRPMMVMTRPMIKKMAEMTTTIRSQFAYSITFPALHIELILVHSRLRENYAKPCLRLEFAYGVTLLTFHIELLSLIHI